MRRNLTKGGGEDGGRAGGGPGYVTELREGSHNNMDNLTVISWYMCSYKTHGTECKVVLTRKRLRRFG